MTAARARAGWLGVAEVGSLWGIRFVVGLCRLFGRGAARAFLRCLAAYYLVFHASARRASRADFTRLTGHGSVGMTYRHLCTFAETALDRLLFAAGKTRMFEVTSNGNEHLEKLRREGRGALLLGAHLGSFEAMRAGAQREDLPINMVVNFTNAKRMQAVLEQLDPTLNMRLISIADGGGLQFVLEIRECIERGEMVAILADRVGPDGRATEAPFLGAPAKFASGPFLLAATLGCPVYLTFGLYRGDNRYDLYCEPFTERLELPRKSREPALREVVARFAGRLEHYVRLAPYNWFNFYDFWSVP
jgi:predicted LPLAT superfamily acyltransferase